MMIKNSLKILDFFSFFLLGLIINLIKDTKNKIDDE